MNRIGKIAIYLLIATAVFFAGYTIGSHVSVHPMTIEEMGRADASP